MAVKISKLGYTAKLLIWDFENAVFKHKGIDPVCALKLAHNSVADGII
jgi:hypothetical protein